MKTNIKLKSTLLVVVTFCVVPISTLTVATPAFADNKSHAEPPILTKIRGMKSSGEEEDKKKDGAFAGMRGKAIQKAAFTYAMQNAVHWKYKRIINQLKKHSTQLDRVFDFKVVAVSNNRVLPPVITEGRDGYRQNSSHSAQMVDKEFEILKPARVVSALPNWRSFLLKAYPAGNTPNSALLPQDSKEQKLWKRSVNDGWEHGKNLATQIYQKNLNRLKREYNGMLMFHRLAKQGYITTPKTAESPSQIKVDGKNLAIGQRKFQITLPSSWNSEDKWKANGSIKN